MAEQAVINITFKQQANTFKKRSERGHVILILKDDTDKTITSKAYKTITEVLTDSTKYTETNMQYIKDALLGLPNRITVVRIDAKGLMVDALKIVSGLKTGRIACPDAVTTETDDIVAFVKQTEKDKKTFHAVVYKPTTSANCKHVEEIQNEKVVFLDSRAEQAGNTFLPTLSGYLCGANVEKGASYMAMANLKSAKEPTDINAEIAKGKITLINDEDKVKISIAVNTLTTLDKENTEDMQYVEVIETEDLILDDIRSTFKESFIGNSRNSVDNQMIFVNAISNYLKGLGQEDILDKNYENKCEINVEKQREELIAMGKTQFANADDAIVKKNTIGRKMFIKGQIKILQSIIDLDFPITIF